jgi:hypothetical protein
VPSILCFQWGEVDFLRQIIMMTEVLTQGVTDKTAISAEERSIKVNYNQKNTKYALS